jgi:hypothetical protein
MEVLVLGDIVERRCGNSNAWIFVGRQRQLPVPVLQQPRQPSNQVMVFSTTVESADHVRMLSSSLDLAAGRGRWNFALDDSDRILRIVSDQLTPATAIQLLQGFGFECNELED